MLTTQTQGKNNMRHLPETKSNQVDSGTEYRQAPLNIEAEQALLGAILINNEAYERVSDHLKAGDFFDPLHARIYETLGKLITTGKVVTPITLKPFFDNEDPIGSVTVPQYLGRLAAHATSIINAPDYAQTIRQLSLRRSLILIGEDMVNLAYESSPDYSADQQIEETETQLYELAENGKYGKGFQSFDAALVAAINTANVANMSDRGISGISTGLIELDRLIGGLHNSDLVILAARPGMGKTSLATNIAFAVARNIREKKTDSCVGFFSLEMSAEQLASRIVSEQAEVSGERIRRGLCDKDEFERIIKQSKNILSGLPLSIDDTGGLSISQLTARARRLKRQHGLSLIIVDYLQLLGGSLPNGYGSRVQEVTQITVGLKALAKELNVPVIALSQLSRQVENREDKRPQLSDLRESGSIEQDADVVLFIYREEYYLKAQEEAKKHDPEWQTAISMWKGRAEVIAAKQRHGPTGTATLQFTGEYTKFSDIARKR
jgi:replicative DNA helicase